MKNTRCRKCTKWFKGDEVSHAACPACDFHTSRCESCGGKLGAMRSVLCHFAYWRTRGRSQGGHAERLRAWVNTNRAKIQKAAEKAVAESLGLH
jgi:hypothetical protein